MSDSSPPIPMPIPLGVYDSGEFASSIDPASLDALKSQGPGGSVSQEVLEAKGASSAAHFGMLGGELDAANLTLAGWAVIFGPSLSPQIRTNLSPLLDLRKQQVANPDLYKILDPPTPSQSAADWLLAHKTSLNVVDPAMGVPYYILIVASPEDISFEFQYELDLYWAVGRLWLNEEQDYERYAHSVVAYENASNQVATSRKMVVFAPDYQGKDNGAGRLMCDNLATPLAASLGKNQKFKIESRIGAEATKENLHGLFNGADPAGPPALLLTASHGLLKLPTSDYLGEQQGAIVCQNWLSPPMPECFYSASDLPETTKVHGMVYFLLACYGLGWPKNDTYNLQKKVAVSPAPMMARLPQLLLGRENGALAVLGHIDRAWSCSYAIAGQPPQNQSFRDVLSKIMSGYRLGSATDQFNMRWAALTVPLADTLQKMRTRRGLDRQAANLWTIRNDARNYILHGDPAIRLRVEPADMPPLL